MIIVTDKGVGKVEKEAKKPEKKPAKKKKTGAKNE